MDILKTLIAQHFSKLILQVWSRSSLYCIRTIGSGYGLSCLFVPGDRHVIVGKDFCKTFCFAYTLGLQALSLNLSMIIVVDCKAVAK